MRKTIRYIDTFSHGPVHELFNAGTLELLSGSSCRIKYHAGRKAAGHVKEFMGAGYGSVIRRTIPVPGGNGRGALLLRYMWSAVMDVCFLLAVPKKDTLVYARNNPFSARMLHRLNLCLKKKIVVFCHGEMETLSPSYRTQGPLSRWIRFSIRRSFLRSDRKLSDKITYVVLSDHILKNLSGIVPEPIQRRFTSIEHPLIFTEVKTEKPGREEGAIRIGVIGSVSPTKGLEELVRIAGYFRNDPRMRFIVTGPAAVKFPEALPENLRMNTRKEYIGRKEYEREIGSMDYILFLYPKYSYRLTASGAFLETLRLGIPVIAMKNDYFEYVFGRFGVWGKTAGSTGEIIRLLEDTVGNSVSPAFDFGRARKEWTLQTKSRIDRLTEED